MAKKFKLGPIPSIEGNPIEVAVLNDDLEPIIEDEKTGRIKRRKGDLVDMLELLIRRFPVSKLTMENITNATRLKSQLIEARKSKDGILVIEEAEHDWIKKMLKDEAIGPQVFMMNLLFVQDAVEGFEKLHESKEKEKEGKEDAPLS